MPRIATPVSDIFLDKKYTKILIEKSDCLELRDRSMDTNFKNEEIFHCEMQPIHEFTKKNFEYIQKIKDKHPGLKLLTFHCASSCNDPCIENGMFKLNGKKYTKQDLLDNAKHNFLKLREILGSVIKIGIENNNYFPTEAYDYVTDPEFISEIIHENQLYFLFDIAHARIVAYNRNIEYGEYKEKLPFDRIIQLHISSYGISDGLACDLHDYPGEEEFNEVRDIISKYDVEYLTIEYYKDIEHLLISLKKIKEIIDEFHGATFQP
ncbi:Uncharacterised protein [uncultured archaeon]|nr:Uncharacterised protein [uncultured archaeon]